METSIPFYELPLLVDMLIEPTVAVSRDLPYTHSSDGPQMDLYMPAAAPPVAGYPLLLLLHGGPVSPGGGQPWPKDWRVFQDYGRLAATLGFAAALPNIRYVNYESLPLALSDTLQVMRFLENEATSYNLDLDHLAVWAFSGAGMLLRPFLQAGLAPGLRGLVAFYPMLDLTHVEQAREFFSEEELISLSPLGYVETMRPELSLFLARAGLDMPGLNRAVDTFVQQALYYNRDLELHNVPFGGHGFDFQNDNPGVRATTAHAFRFVTTCLREETHHE